MANYLVVWFLLLPHEGAVSSVYHTSKTGVDCDFLSKGPLVCHVNMGLQELSIFGFHECFSFYRIDRIIKF